jgi:hypothetical protein
MLGLRSLEVSIELLRFIMVKFLNFMTLVGKSVY